MSYQDEMPVMWGLMLTQVLAEANLTEEERNNIFERIYEGWRSGRCYSDPELLVYLEQTRERLNQRAERYAIRQEQPKQEEPKPTTPNFLLDYNELAELDREVQIMRIERLLAEGKTKEDIIQEIDKEYDKELNYVARRYLSPIPSREIERRRAQAHLEIERYFALVKGTQKNLYYLELNLIGMDLLKTVMEEQGFPEEEIARIAKIIFDESYTEQNPEIDRLFEAARQKLTDTMGIRSYGR